MPRNNRLIDWKFLAMLTVMLLAAVACWGFVARQKQVDSLIEIGQRSTEQVRILSAKVDTLNAEADAARKQASDERAALSAQIDRQADRNRQMRRLIEAMADVLRANGLSVPEPSVSEPPPPKPQAPSGASPKPKPSTSSPRPTPTPAPTPKPNPMCGLVPLLCP